MKRKTFILSLLLFPVWKLIGAVKAPIVEACKTQGDAEGPYYKEGAPLKAIIETQGEPLTVSGTIYQASDCSTPVPNAIIDIWHCDSAGNYDSEGFKCRGLVKTDSKGQYSFKTIYPPHYGSRPRHIHFKVRANGFKEITSQIYFQGDPSLKNDFARNALPARILAIDRSAGQGQAQFNIYL